MVFSMFTVLMYTLLWLCPFICFLCVRRYACRRYNQQWSKNMMFILGNRGWKTFKKVPMNDFIQIYREFPDEKINSFYNILESTILVRDVSLISKIVQIQRDYYQDQFRQSDYLHAKSLKTSNHSFFLKHLPAHFNQIKICVANIFERVEYCGRKHFDAKELFSRFSCDVLVYSIMGRRHDSFKYVFNPLYLLVTEMSDYNEVGCLKNLFSQIFPNVSKVLGLTMKNDIVLESIRTLVEARKYGMKVDHDYIHFLIESQRESGLKMDLADHVLRLYMNSFEICTNLLSYMAYELSMNPKVQQILYAEIQTLMLQCDGSPGCEEIMMMEYLHMVVSETLRKWPIIPAATTVCTKKMELDNCVFWKGEHIVIPIAGLHRDPKYFPNPTEFNPERFSEDRREEIIPHTYHPFGLGFKTCLGSTLAFIQAKILFVYLLSKYEFYASPYNNSIEYVTKEKTFTLCLEYRNKINPDDQVEV